MIGVFDSGFGGLSVFREITRELPEYDFVYFGDNARAPYGGRSHQVIYQYTREACEWLFRQGCELIILACNTASAQALRRLQQEYLPAAHPERRILGVLIPIAQAVAEHVRAGDKVGVIATRATVESGAYLRELQKFIPPGVDVIQQACTLFVPLVEEGWLDSEVTRAVAVKYLAPLRDQRISILILGCTHYSFLRPIIQEIVGSSCFTPNPGVTVAASLRAYLDRHPDVAGRLSQHGSRRYVTTDQPERFAQFATLVGDGVLVSPEQMAL